MKKGIPKNQSLEKLDQTKIKFQEEKMKDKFKEFGCEFKNESQCEEELDDEGLSLDDIEEDHFEKDSE